VIEPENAEQIVWPRKTTPGSAQLRHRRSVLGPDVALERGRAVLGGAVLEPDGVLHAERDPAERGDRRAAAPSGGEPLVGGARLRERPVAVHADEGVVAAVVAVDLEVAVQRVDPLEVRLGQLDRGDVAGLQQGGDLVDLQVDEPHLLEPGADRGGLRQERRARGGRVGRRRGSGGRGADAGRGERGAGADDAGASEEAPAAHAALGLGGGERRVDRIDERLRRDG
jgi:hypothetical protein